MRRPWAVEASGFLARWMKEPDLATLDQVEPSLNKLSQAIEALPPTVADAATMCYLRNYSASSLELFSCGEWGGARHQLEQIRRKLGRVLLDEN